MNKAYKIFLKVNGEKKEKIVGEQCLKEIKKYLGVVPLEEVKSGDYDFYSVADFWKDFPLAKDGTNNIKQFKEFEDARAIVLQLLLEKKRNDATEVVATEFLKKHHIYTTRHDEKPECWIYEKGIYVPHAKTYLKEFCEAILQKAYTTNFLNAVYAKIEVRTYISQENFFINEDSELLPVQNGILNIKTRELLEFSPNFFFFNKLPIVYDVEKECPNIEAFFYDILKDESDFLVMQELFGFLLLRDYKYEKAFMFTGSGRNGKGKTVELMKSFLGVKNCSNISLQALEKDQYAMGELFNKMANLSADISSQALRHTGSFKSLTGHDLVSAPRKFLSMVNFVNYAKMIFCANELPQTNDLSEAFFDRWIILDFPFKFLPEQEYNQTDLIKNPHIKKQDPYKIEKLTTEDELSGLLNWALTGYERIVANKGFSYSKSTEETKLFWIRRSNSGVAFINEHIEEGWGSYILKRDFRKVYREFCRQNKIKSLSDRAIKNVIEEHMGGSDGQRVPFALTDDEYGKKREYVWLDIIFKKETTEKYKVKNFEDLHGD